MPPRWSAFTKKSVPCLFTHLIPQNWPFNTFSTSFIPFLIVVSHYLADYIFPDRIVSPLTAGLSLSYPLSSAFNTEHLLYKYLWICCFLYGKFRIVVTVQRWELFHIRLSLLIF